MNKIQLIHPENKKAPTMDKTKYDALKISFLSCLKKKKQSTFQTLSAEVEADLKKRSIRIEGKLEWNLFWVTLDLEARKELTRDKTISPMLYSLPT